MLRYSWYIVAFASSVFYSSTFIVEMSQQGALSPLQRFNQMCVVYRCVRLCMYLFKGFDKYRFFLCKYHLVVCDWVSGIGFCLSIYLVYAYFGLYFF